VDALPLADEPKKIKFYTDTHIAKAVAVQLRNRGVDIVRCEEVGLAEASDLEHLEYALKHDRVVITNDDDFLATIKGWQSQGRNHVGMMYCLPHVQGTGAIGKIVNLCFELHELIEGGAGTVEEDIVNHVIYVS
jgi:hypothetical protein